MTHNGLKVRLNHDFCAQYMDEENILAWYISIEAFDSLRVVLSIITAIVIMFMHEDPIYSGGEYIFNCVNGNNLHDKTKRRNDHGTVNRKGNATCSSD